MTNPTPAYQRFFAELKRRRVFRVMAVYGATGFIVLQVADLLAEGLALPDVVLRAATFLILIGFTLMGEGLDMHTPKGYIYFAMAFSLFVEILNMKAASRGAKPVQLR